MATFSQWLGDQRDRQDAVGWFARYWNGLTPKPRLSSPSSIMSHLEDREEGGFKSGQVDMGDGSFVTGQHVRDAFDQVLKEYRQVRAHIAEAVSGVRAEPGQDPLPGTGELTPGQVVRLAADAGLAAAGAARIPLPERGRNPELAILVQIVRDVELIKLALGIARDEDGHIVRFPPAAGMPGEVMDWAGWFSVADLSAVPE